MTNNVFINFTYDLSEQDSSMHIKPAKPTLMKAVFYDATTHERVAENVYDEKGGQVYGILPGTYDVVAYSGNCEYTEIDGAGNFTTLRAFTSEVKMDTDSLGKVIRQPDHLLVGRTLSVTVPPLSSEDTAFVIDSKVSTIMDSYYLQVDSLKGLENISTVDVYLTGHSSSNNFGTGERSNEAATVHIPCYVNLEKYCLYSRFITFGKIPSTGGKAVLHIVVTGQGGSVYDFSQDITGQYSDPRHILKLCIYGEIKREEPGSFDPNVKEWDDDISHIDL